MAELIELLPLNYKNSQEVLELQEALGNQIEAVAVTKADLFRQIDVNTATWGLTYWEQAYGLKTDVSKSYNYRRTRVRSKMRGAGTTTKVMTKNVAESFSNGQVEVNERGGEYQFEIKFVGALGIPPNLDDLKDAIEEIKPAHLRVVYGFRYFTIAQVQAMTLDEMQAQKLSNFAPFAEIFS